ncbi:sugar ABC transporter ATP-binding protein [Candidatus Latescibacterota bacterium]
MVSIIPEADNILELNGITKVFPGVKALDNVSFDVQRGEVHALVGENGAGKTTLMHIIGGIYRPTSGRIFLNGEKVRFGNAHDAHLRGIRVVYQELSIVPSLNAAENIFANSQPVNKLGLIKFSELNRRAVEMIQLFGEDIDPSIPAGQLSIGKRQILEILKALTFNPQVVLLDEPTSSLSGVEMKMLFKTIRKLKNEGISFIFISHHLPEIFEIADRVSVLRDGVYQGTFVVSDIIEDDLIHSMVGRSIDDMFAARTFYEGESLPVLEVEGLNRFGEFEDVSFTIRAGEIVGFAGLVGAGRTNIARTIFGIQKADSGVIRIYGERVNIRSVRDAIKYGIGYLTEDRKLQGLYLSLSIRENLVSPSLGRFTSKAGIISDNRINRFAKEMVGRYTIVSPTLEHVVFNLSGGNQQKVLLGMWMGINPAILIVDEPTKGIDVGAKQEIYAHINELAASGAAIMLISSDLNEILGMSDRICVMKDGHIQKIIRADDASEEMIIYHALGAGEAVT